MEKNTKDSIQKVELFLTALLQVSFVAMNITFISKGLLIYMVITGFLISLIWTFNVKKVAFGSHWDRVIYALGAATGTLIGYELSHFLTKAL